MNALGRTNTLSAEPHIRRTNAPNLVSGSPLVELRIPAGRPKKYLFPCSNFE